MNNYATQDLRLRRIIQLAAFGLLLAGCQPSAENRLLQDSAMTVEDPKFYPSDEYIRTAKVNFRNGDYGLAESNYRKAVEVTPKDAEAWLGLADRKSTRLNSSHIQKSRMPSSA